MVAMARHHDSSTDVWIRRYLQSLLDDPALRVPSGLVPLWLDQQVDPAAERLRDNVARITILHVVNRSPRSVVLGPAGSGKSTLARHLVRQLADEALAQPQAWLPLYLPLRSFAGSVEGTLSAQAHMRAPALATLALQRPCILIIDALNDVAPNEQLEVLGMLRRAMTQLGPQGRWLLFCRSEHWALFAPWLQTLQSEVWRIRPWNDQMVNGALQRLSAPGLQRLIGYRGCVELARRPRWLGSLSALAAGAALPPRPAQIAVAWVQRVFADAADAHCLPEACAQAGLTLLCALAEALAPRPALSRSAVMALTLQVADEAGVSGEELLTLLDASGLLHPSGEDEWTLRSSLLADLAQALLARHATPEQWRALIGRGQTLPLLYGLLPEPAALVTALLDAEAWEEVRRVLDANEEPTAALETLGATERVSIDVAAALGRVWARGGQPRVAIRLLSWAIERGRDDPQLYGLLGDLYLGERRWALARDAFTAALRRDPTNLHYQQALARACHELGEDEVATRTLEQVLSTHHRQLAEAAYSLGQVYEQQQRYADALDRYMTAASLVTTDARYRLAQARTLRLLGRLEEARSLLRSLQAMSIEPADLAQEWAELMLAQGNDRQALLHLDHLVELNAADANVYLKIGQIRRRLGETLAARQAFAMAIDLDPRCAQAYEQLAGMAIDQGDLHTAASAYRRLIELHPDDAAVYRRLGALLRELGQHGDAVQVLLHSLQVHPHPHAYLELARVRWAQGEQARALDNYRLARELDPTDVQIAAETGWALIESGDPRAALEPLQAAAAIQPTNARVLYDLGRAYELQGRPAEALEWYERAATVAPAWLVALRATGRLAQQVGFSDLARRYLVRALRLARRDAETWADVGRLHLQMRAAGRAERALRRALELGNVAPAVRRDLAQALLLNGRPADALRMLEQIGEEDADVEALRSQAYEQLGDLRNALLIARAAAAQRPRDAALQRRIGALALRVNHVSEALMALERAIALDDSDPRAQLDLSRALLRAGRAEAALQPAQLAVERDPRNPAAHEQLGLTLLALRQLDAAEEAFSRAIELDPHSADAWGGLADVWHVRHSVAAALPYARHALELAPDNDRHRLRIAQLLAAAGDYDQAQAVLATLREAHLEADRLLLSIALATEQWSLALETANRALSAVPDDAEILAIYGHSLVQLGRPAEAVPALVRACAAAHATAQWWAWQAAAHLALHQWEAAARALERSVQLDPHQPERFVALAQAYLCLNQPQTAVQALRAALEQDATRADWYALLAQAYETLGWRQEALEAWQHAAERAPEVVAYQRQIGRLLLALGQPQAALERFESIAAQSDGDRETWELYARAALAVADPARAAYAAACALHLAPAAAEPRELLGEALLQRGDPARALSYLTPLLDSEAPSLHALLLTHTAAEAAQQPTVARRALELAVRQAPDAIEVQLRLARHLHQSEPERAIKIMRQLAQREPRRADIQATLADYLLARNDVTHARAAAEAAVELAPSEPAYRRLLGQICMRLGDHDAARANFQQVLAHQPRDAATALALGRLALERHESSEAIRLLQLAAQYAPDDADVLGTLGLALRQACQPVHEDELLEAQRDPLLTQALTVLERAAAAAPHWRAELGWTRLIAGESALAVEDLAAALPQLSGAERVVALRRLALALMSRGEVVRAARFAEHAAALAPDDALIASIQGQVAERQGDVYAAVRAYTRAVTHAPDQGRYHLRLGAALLATDEYETALEHLQRATQLEPARAEAWMLLSRACLQVRQPERALQAAQRAVQLAQEHAAAWYQLAEAARALDQTRLALEAFERATTLQPTKAWLVAYADFALERGQTERGRAVLQRAVQLDPADAELAYRLAQLSDGQAWLTQLERAVQLDPARIAWRRELGDGLLRRGQAQQALPHLAQVVEAEPHVAEHWIALAHAQQQSGEPTAALATLQRALSVLPDSVALRLALASHLAAQRQWREACEYFSAAAQQQPSAAALAGQGHCLLHLERLSEAQQVLEAALQLAPDDVGALIDLATIHYRQARFKQAIGVAKRALTYDALAIDAYRIVAEAALALRGDWVQEAHEALERALAIAPDAPFLHALQSMAYFEEGAYQEALLAARQAVRAAPDEPEYLMQEARVLRRLRRFHEAMALLRQAVRIKKNYREALIAMAEITTEIFLHGDRSASVDPNVVLADDDR